MKKLIYVLLICLVFASCKEKSREEIIKDNFSYSRGISISDDNITIVIEMMMCGSTLNEMVKINLVTVCNSLKILAMENSFKNVKIIYEFPFKNKQNGKDEYKNVLEFDIDREFCMEIMSNGSIPYNLIENMKNIKADLDIKAALNTILYYKE